MAYPQMARSNGRQARLHTCFSYCNSGPDKSMSPDMRPDCSDLSPGERDQIFCLYPNTSCEATILNNEVTVSDEPDMAFDPLIMIFAILTGNPAQIIFEVLCVILLRMQITNKESTKENCQILSMQLLLIFIFSFILA